MKDAVRPAARARRDEPQSAAAINGREEVLEGEGIQGRLVEPMGVDPR